MKKLVIVLVALVIAVSCTFVGAAENEYAVGEVLYHQNFAHVSSFGKSGITVGTLSTPNATYSCVGDYLEVKTMDSGRAYHIFPGVERGEDYTIEFTFKFTDTTHGNGYIAYMLTCRGEEPANITPFIIRADGTVDDFSAVPEELTAAIAGGEEIKVIIPVEENVLYGAMFCVDDKVYEVERDSILSVGDGGMGFLYRYIGVNVLEVYIVNGTGYSEKTGEYAESSFVNDNSSVVVPNGGNVGEGAPGTYDKGVATLVACTCAAGAALVLIGTQICIERKRKQN